MQGVLGDSARLPCTKQQDIGPFLEGNVGEIMQQIGLALSGGGFRATLYHLGVVRFLRDAGLLGHVSHITSVSGGSVLGAHLALNWDRYCGSEKEFDDAANELTRFIQLDVRNRIVRRYPLAAILNSTRRVIRAGSSRRLTRPGLLESHYEKYLFGDKCLSELPEHPQLHILATNVGEGSLCSFTRRGIILQTRSSNDQQGFKLVQADLATVSMAVAASSAFPGFFPPLELTACDVGVTEGEFPPHSFTDGAIFDNLGIRMFRWIEQSWMQKDKAIRVEDFTDIEAIAAVIREAASSGEESPVHRIASLITPVMPNQGQADSISKTELAGGKKQLAESLWSLIENQRLYLDPSFREVHLKDPAAQSLLHLARSTDRIPEWGDHLALNRQLIDSALEQATGRPCFCVGDATPKVILVSDAGKKMSLVPGGQGSGLIQTAIRSSEILMDRVWQLEKETFENLPGCLFASINDTVPPSEDHSALPVGIQRQVSRIRTDLDYFDDLEIRSLARHGYCVARQTCRSNSECFGNNLASGPQWDLINDTHKSSHSLLGPISEPIAAARKLQKSSKMRIWSSMFSLNDWPTYVWIPLIILFLFGGPYLFLTAQRTAQRNETVSMAVSQAKQIEVQIASSVRSLRADAAFMSTLPPIQEIINARKVAEEDAETKRDSEGEEVWSERLETIFEGLLRANPSCQSGTYFALEEYGGQEIVRVERYEKESALVHTVPQDRLNVIALGNDKLKEAKRLRPGEIKVFCSEVTRDGSTKQQSSSKQLIAAAAIHDVDTGELFGFVVLELNLASAIGNLLLPAMESVDNVYITDQEGTVLLSSRADAVAKSSESDSKIVTLAPQTAGFLDPDNQAKTLTDHDNFVALKIWLDPNDPASVVGVVIRITP
jgi:predicted acylesterase/phospholipase RssA